MRGGRVTPVTEDLGRREATERARAPEDKPGVPQDCRSRFDAKLAAIGEQAAAKGVACRYGENGDQTLTDYDTGLTGSSR